MQKINKVEHVKYSQQQMFNLVNDVKSYQEFVPWCYSSKIIDGEPEQWMLAKLGFNFHGIKHSFTTKNRLNKFNFIDIELVDGPFEHLEGIWRFIDKPNGCDICLDLEYQFISDWLGSVFEPAFVHVSSLLVSTFKDRAYAIYE